MFPCSNINCASPASQMNALDTYIQNSQITYGQLWLDIEGPTLWTTSTSTNQKFFNGLINQANALSIYVI